MGQKVHPYGFRVGIVNNWKSRWFSKKEDFPQRFLEDIQIKKYIKKKLFQAAIANIEIEINGTTEQLHNITNQQKLEIVKEFLEGGGADRKGASTATEIIEYLRSNCGKRQLPSTGAISHSLRGVRDSRANKVFIEVGQTKVARGDSRKRGYMVSVWALTNNPHLKELQKTYRSSKN